LKLPLRRSVSLSYVKLVTFNFVVQSTNSVSQRYQSLIRSLCHSIVSLPASVIMVSSFLKVCLLALTTASSVLAQTPGFDVFTQPITPGSTFAAGSTMQITWTPSAPAGKISILLLEGATNTSLQLDPTPVACTFLHI
jgi:hypothetical protein